MQLKKLAILIKNQQKLDVIKFSKRSLDNFDLFLILVFLI